MPRRPVLPQPQHQTNEGFQITITGTGTSTVESHIAPWVTVTCRNHTVVLARTTLRDTEYDVCTHETLLDKHELIMAVINNSRTLLAF